LRVITRGRPSRTSTSQHSPERRNVTRCRLAAQRAPTMRAVSVVIGSITVTEAGGRIGDAAQDLEWRDDDAMR